MKGRFIQRGKVDIKVIFRNGSSFEYTYHGTLGDLLEDTQYLYEAKEKDLVPGELHHLGHWSFDLSKVMAIFVGDITSTNEGGKAC